MRIDDADGLVEFRGDVEQAIFGTEEWTVGTNRMAEIKMPGQLAGGNVDDRDLGAIGSRLANAGVSIDRYERGSTVGRGNHLVARDSALRNFGYLFLFGRGHNPEGMISLIRNEQQAARMFNVGTVRRG
jgi:hypothetical protein